MIQQREQCIATVISYSITDCINGIDGVCSVAFAGAEEAEKDGWYRKGCTHRTGTEATRSQQPWNNVAPACAAD